MNIYTDRAAYVLGFHGCDQSVADKVLNSHSEHLKPSENDYDWLGSGIYFWLNDPVRALEWAKVAQARNPNNIKKPAVIGAILDLKVCLNLLERDCIDTLKEGYSLFKDAVSISKDLQNKTPDKGGFHLLRYLDCAVINYTYSILESKGMPFDSVMGAFQESSPAFEGSDILEKTHIQICIRNKDCILGYFLPRDEKET